MYMAQCHTFSVRAAKIVQVRAEGELVFTMPSAAESLIEKRTSKNDFVKPY